MLLHINASNGGWHCRTGRPWQLAEALARLAPDQPVPILIHGLRYAPGVPGKDPHDQILSAEGLPQLGLPSWPRHLGLREGQPQLMLAFGWQAGGTLWAARRQCTDAGRALAGLIADIHALSPGRRISVMAHSLGARVLWQALPHLASGSLWRAVLLYPATLRAETERALATPAGQSAEVVNITSGENRFFDYGHALLTAGLGARPLGRGLRRVRAGWLDLRIDCETTLNGLECLGFRIGRRERRVCHWSSYLRPGIFSLYRALIAVPDALSLTALERACQKNYRQAP